MYTIFADDVLIYDSTVEDFKIGKGFGTMETNKAGSFTFSVYPDHFFYNRFVKKKTVIVVKKSGKIFFRGRVLDDKVDIWNRREVICEGELNFLLDSVIRPYSFSGTPEEAFRKYVTEHNAQVDDFKRFRIGNVTVYDPNNYIARSNSGYESALKNLTSRLLEDSLGGFLHITHGDDGTDPVPTLHYLADFQDISSQTIEFGSNLKDYLKKSTGQAIATAVIPLGAKMTDGASKTEDLRLTIASVNEGTDYVFDETAVAEHGWIFDTVIFDDVTLPENLKKKGLEELEKRTREDITLELTALDLHLLNRSIESFRYNTYIRCISMPHSFVKTLLCYRQTFNVLKPDSDTVTLGNQRSSFTASAAKTSAEVSAVPGLQRSFDDLSSRTFAHKIAEQQLTNLLAQSFGVFKTETVLEDGSTIFFLHDKPQLSDSLNIWKMTGSVMAVSSDGGKTWNAGVDTSGNAVYNILSVIGIDAEWIVADNLESISANLGGWEIRDDAIFKEVVDSSDSNLVYQFYIRAPKETFVEGASTLPILEVMQSEDGGATFQRTVHILGQGYIGQNLGDAHSALHAGNAVYTHDTQGLRADCSWNGITIRDAATWNYRAYLCRLHPSSDITYCRADIVTGGQIRSDDGYSGTVTIGSVKMTFSGGTLTSVS